MAEFSAKRVVAIAAIAGALVGGAVAAGVAVATTSGNHDNTASSSVGTNSVSTAPVIRTNLTASVQVAGSIGYNSSYTVVVPSGSSSEQVTQDQLIVTEDQETLSADEQAASDESSADDQAITADQTNVNAAQSALTSDENSEAQDCGVTGASSAACSQETQQVSSDQTQLTQTEQQLASARASATSDHDQNQAKVQSDQTKLQGDQATLALERSSAANPGTTYTSVPDVGDVIKEDETVYSLSDVAVPLLYGSTPDYRAFSVGMSDGADVDELTEDLISLGYGTGLTQSDHYSSAAVDAVERWQRALGLPVTGEILLGQVVFEPGPIRVTSVVPSVGESVGGGTSGAGASGTVLTATSTTPIVTVDLDVSQEYLVKPGDAVSIVLPDGTSTVGGHIETVGNVATCPGASNDSADLSPCSSSGSGTNSTPTVNVSITLDSTPTMATLDQAPVNVDVTTQRADDVLAVPVNALLALRSGGFGVDIVAGTTSHLVRVTTGLYSNTLVQISGSGIGVGARVEVPSS
jgi:Putative peptidoglycan binding domain